MDISSIVKVMVANGASIELVSAVVEEVERQRNASLEIVREKKRLQKRKERMMSHDVAATGGDNERQEATGSDLSSPLNGFPPANRYNIYTPPSLNSSSLNTSFADFWTNYPRKISKGAALKAYKKALTKTDAETILKAVKAYPWPADKEFLPHASTWLNGERWTDETVETKTRPPQARPKQIAEMTEEERTAFLTDFWKNKDAAE
jgi:hypothetical protein